MINVLESAYKSVVIEGDVVVSEGMRIRFACESGGEVVEGCLVKITGKKDKTKFQIIPLGAVKQEIWNLADIAGSSLEIIEQ